MSRISERCKKSLDVQHRGNVKPEIVIGEKEMLEIINLDSELSNLREQVTPRPASDPPDDDKE